VGWGHCGEVNGREVGYLIEAECDHPECNAKIDRGLGFCCGGMHGGGGYYHKGTGEHHGCGGYFCGDHLEYEQLCFACAKPVIAWEDGHGR